MAVRTIISAREPENVPCRDEGRFVRTVLSFGVAIARPHRVVTALVSWVVLFACGPFAAAQVNTAADGGQSAFITTIAGASYPVGDGGPATYARLDGPGGMAVDALGNLYIADAVNSRVRRVDPGGTITTVAGTGERGFAGDGGPATSATLGHPEDVAVDALGNLYIADTNNWRVRRVDPSGTITTVAGGGTGGDGGPATSAALEAPGGVAVDALGNLYIAAKYGNQVRRVDLGGTITTVAGVGRYRFTGDGGPATSAALETPGGVAVDALGSLYIADWRDGRVRRVDPGGTITTVAGNGESGFTGDGGPATSAALGEPRDVAVDGAGNLYIAVLNRVRRVDPGGTITTVAGTGEWGFAGDGGPATSAEFGGTSAVAVDGAGNLYVADTGNDRVRRVDPGGTITTVAVLLDTYLDDLATGTLGNLYVGSHYQVWRVDPGGTITAVAGSGEWGFAGDGGPATSAEFRGAKGVAVDALGNLYIADKGNSRVRRVDPSGTITTVVGNGERGFAGDGGPATSAALDLYTRNSSNADISRWLPVGVAVDAMGNLYIADRGNSRVRRVTFGSVVPSPPADDHGNDGAGATRLELDSSLTGMIGTSGDEDWFRLEFSERTHVAIYTTGSLGTTGTLLVESTGREVAADNGGAANFRIEASVEPGVYFAKVAAHGDGTGDYTLHVSRRTVLMNAYGMEFELVPAGQFEMGSTSDEADSDEQPVTQVEISQAFYMGKYEVTQGQWKAVMGEDSNPSRSRMCDACPVDSVTLEETLEFVRRLNEALEDTLYRLPTEAEWEYAARAGETGERYGPLDEVAWHGGNSDQMTHPVGEKRANAFGLHDTLGNVWEWVEDRYGQYAGGQAVDPGGPVSGQFRVSRGGSWYSESVFCRLANRYATPPSRRGHNIGFRLALDTASASSATTDDHGNRREDATRLDATNIDIGISVDGEIHHQFDPDYFRLELPEKTDLLIYTTGSLKTQGVLTHTDDEGETQILASNVGTSGADNFVIKASLDPGVYFVRVTGRLARRGDYTLHAVRQKPTAIRACLTAEDSVCGSDDSEMEFVRVRAGEFYMGSEGTESSRSEQPVTPVKISQEFYMGRYEVTQGQWKAVMGPDSNPSQNSVCDECPVDSVTWNDVQQFVATLNDIANGTRRYRLPTEAEWEYAARASSTGERYSDDLAQIAWYRGNSLRRTHAVGQKLPNAFGLYDMLGNVREWVQDWSSGIYPGERTPIIKDPIGPGVGRRKLVRGCSSFSFPQLCRSARRAHFLPDYVGPGTIGFRLVTDGAGTQPQRFVLDDHPDIPLEARTDELPSNGVFRREGELAVGDDVDLFKLDVDDRTTARFYTSGELEVELVVGQLLATEGGRSEFCSTLEPEDTASDTFNLEPGSYCIQVRLQNENGTGGPYTLVAETQTGPEPLALELGAEVGLMTIPADADDRFWSVPKTSDVEIGEPYRVDRADLRHFEFPGVTEKTRFAIYVSSQDEVDLHVPAGTVVESSTNSDNFPVVIDLEPGNRFVVVVATPGERSFALLVEEMRAIREERTWKNSLEMEFVKLPSSGALKVESRRSAPAVA